MILKLKSPVEQMSGALGSVATLNTTAGIVAMPDSNGRTLARDYVIPVQPNSSPQQLAKARVSAIVEAYQSLTLVQVDEWQALAEQINKTGRLGQDYKLNWTMLFQQVNNYRLQDGQAITSTPPSIAAAPIVTSITDLTSDEGIPDQALRLTFVTAAATASGFWAVRFTRPLGSPVRQARDTDFRYVNTPAACLLPRTNSTTQALDITSTLINIMVDDHVGVEIKALNADYVPTSVFVVRNRTVQSV